MKQVQGVQRLRQLNKNKIEVTQHSVNDVINQQNFQSIKSVNKQQHNHDDYDEQHHHKHDGSHDHTHQNGQQCSHQHGNRRRKTGKQRTNYIIIFYTIFTMYSCVHLEAQYFRSYLPNQQDYKDLLIYISYIDVIMCFISYIVTIKSSNKFPKMKIQPPSLQNLGVYDKAYSISSKNCDKCSYPKMPRISHCSSCGYCIAKLDHHCIWSQNCIGYVNHKSFYLFTLFMFIGVVIYWYFTVYTFMGLYGTCKFFSTFSALTYIWWVITSLSASLVGIMIAGLCLSQAFMILTNFSTLDGMKKKKMCNLPVCEWRQYFLNDQNINIYDRGQIQNWKQLFGNSILTFFIPNSRPLNNQFLIQKMNPYPTKLQLMQFSGEIAQETSRELQLRKIIKGIKSSYKGKQFKIQNQVIIVQ